MDEQGAALSFPSDYSCFTSPERCSNWVTLQRRHEAVKEADSHVCGAARKAGRLLLTEGRLHGTAILWMVPCEAQVGC